LAEMRGMRYSAGPFEVVLVRDGRRPAVLILRALRTHPRAHSFRGVSSLADDLLTRLVLHENSESGVVDCESDGG